MKERLQAWLSLQYLKNILQIYKKIWRIDKLYIFNTIMIIIVQSVHPFVNIIFLKYVIDELTTRRRMEYVVAYVIIVCLTEFALRIAQGIFSSYELKKIIQFKSVFIKELNDKTMTLSFQQIEDTYLINDRQKALEIFYPGQAHFMDLKNTIIDSKSIVSHIIRFVGTICILVKLNIVLFLLLLLTYFVSNVLNTIAADKEFNVWSNSLVEIGRKVGYFQELSTEYSYAKEMRINRLGQWVVDKMYYFFRLEREEIEQSVKTFVVMQTISNTLQNIINAGAYLFLGWMAYKGICTLSEMIVFINTIGVFIIALLGISHCYISLQKAGWHLSIYFQYMNVESNREKKDVEQESLTLGKSSFATIEFQNVWFQYPGREEYTIKNLSFRIDNGEKIAIVGENGAGKTTIIKLLLRLYQPTKGKILMNGVDISKIDFDEYVKRAAVVFQDFNILEYTLRENITMGSKTDQMRIEEIVKQLNLEEMVSKTPKKYETILGRRFAQDGIELSGGQQQKIAIARALYKDSSLIILDEPTAMLSPTAEFEIYSQFSKMTSNRTAIYISHRMSSCIFCDRIIVMNKGEMVELGSHDELMKNKSVYHTLFTTQAEFYKKLENKEETNGE